ncbi:MAG: hypothetical protein Aurels2KO_25830 [Aureliella sp.]
MLRRTIIILIATAHISFASQGLAQETKRSWWNPLGLIKEDSTRSSSFFDNVQASDDSVQPASAWKTLPEMKKPKFPSMKEIGRSTKSMWLKTTSFINPFDKPRVETSLVPADQGYKPQAQQEAKPKRLFGWLWDKPAEPTKPQSVNDWLNQSNPVLDRNLY